MPAPADPSVQDHARTLRAPPVLAVPRRGDPTRPSFCGPQPPRGPHSAALSPLGAFHSLRREQARARKAETAITPAWNKAFRGEITAKDAVDESTRAATAFWQGIGGNASKAL
ncbi:MAG TPA: hypothetical protein VFX49_11175 [Chloroflexota bacterium]|nr:hypothetical protein [Chloroflexota bacterium]